MDQSLLYALLIGVSVAISAYSIAILYSMPSSQERKQKIIEAGNPSEYVRDDDEEPLYAVAHKIAKVFKLQAWLSFEEMDEKLRRAGLRSIHAETGFLISRFLSAIFLIVLSICYLSFIHDTEISVWISMSIVALSAYVGLKLPEIVISQIAATRMNSIRAAWPDALDLLLILVEAGKTIEQAFRRVAEDIGSRSQPLAEELTITLSELAFLPERRLAYESLGKRTDLPEIKSACMAINQAELQGTSLAATFRDMASESRALRISATERKGARSATLLVIPVAIFFLPPVLVLSIAPMLIAFLNGQ